jgi:DNA-directed RNA polymerase specialized sigma24 family protein
VATVREVRRVLVEASRRHSRVAHEAEDLAHDIILSALRRGLPLDDDAFVRSAPRAARQHGAFLARSAMRRRARETFAATELGETAFADTTEDTVEGAPLETLSPTLRTTLQLLVSGLEKAELRSVLGVNDTALRKRFSALRGHAPLSRRDLPTAPRHADGAMRLSQVKLLPSFAGRRARDAQVGRVLGAADPDGHGIIFTELLTTERDAATARALAPDSAPREKGNPCSTASSRTSRSSSS